MEKPGCKIIPLGEEALTIEFGNRIEEKTNEFVVALANSISENAFDGFIECVPAYSSLTVFYSSSAVSAHADSPFEFVSRFVSEHISIKPGPRQKRAGPIEIPVDFSVNAGPDLEFVASHSGLDADSVIKIFTERTYRVYMLGFLPGFPYMGTVDARIAAPRLETPRLRVSKGSVGIAGRQTGVYSMDSPGGWRLIGRTDVELFTPADQKPALLSPGDTVRFVRL